MADVSGYFYMDGIDLWAAFNMFIEEGSTDFLRIPPRKDSITHDWQDSNGLDIDVSRNFFQERPGTLNCAIIVDNEVDFWAKYTSFIATLTQPGLRRLSFTSHGNRSYFILYKECTNWTKVKALLGKDEAIFGPNKVAGKFSLNIVEPEPRIDPSDIFIIDEAGRFLIT